MKILLSTLTIMSFCLTSLAQSGSEIYILDLKEKKGKITLSNPRNITNRIGYDNQPSFHKTEKVLYFSSFDESGRADLKSYNLKTKETKNVTTTPEREYSPTLTPDGDYLSCIIQRDNGAQDLGKYPVEGGEAIAIIDNMIVGYHVWADNSHLALFVLGKDGAPNSLHYLELPTREDMVLAENIGRSLHRIPSEEAISYVAKVGADNWEIRKLNLDKLDSEKIATTLPGKEDICWTAAGTLLSSDGEKIYMLQNEKWIPLPIKGLKLPLKGITRLAVNAQNTTLAIVISE
ncbi:TolB family protein [Chryseotalea sanaruensis]|nr:PD40 domain-containing protein [Chryseotalea sanaruensis]